MVILLSGVGRKLVVGGRGGALLMCETLLLKDPTIVLGYVGRFLSKISFIQQFIFAQLSV